MPPLFVTKISGKQTLMSKCGVGWFITRQKFVIEFEQQQHFSSKLEISEVKIPFSGSSV